MKYEDEVTKQKHPEVEHISVQRGIWDVVYEHHVEVCVAAYLIR
ncbi:MULTISPECIES: hypothetical protein [unclassified Archaeoglobus]|nr:MULTISPECIES: hypothetical protein [unclassified Archaeoglobus]